MEIVFVDENADAIDLKCKENLNGVIPDIEDILIELDENEKPHAFKVLKRVFDLCDEVVYIYLQAGSVHKSSGDENADVMPS